MSKQQQAIKAFTNWFDGMLTESELLSHLVCLGVEIPKTGARNGLRERLEQMHADIVDGKLFQAEVEIECQCPKCTTCGKPAHPDFWPGGPGPHCDYCWEYLRLGELPPTNTET
jgi:hypothetical protein